MIVRALRLALVALLSAGASAGSAQPLEGPADTRAEVEDPRLARWLERARALLERAPSRSAFRRARLLLERAVEHSPGEPAIAEVAALRLPGTARAAAGLGADERRDASGWVLAILDGMEPPGDQAARNRVERVRGWALAVGGELERSLTLLRESAGVHDESAAAALRRLAALAIRSEALALGERALVQARRSWARDATLVADLAAVRLARGAPEAAVRLLRSELQHHPNDPSLREDLAGALLAVGQPEEALRVWRALAQASRHAETTGRYRRAGAQAALAAGRAEAARVEARRALGVNPEDGEARLLLGLALIASGHPALGRAELLRARSLLGRDLRVDQALEALETSEGGEPPPGET